MINYIIIGTFLILQIIAIILLFKLIKKFTLQSFQQLEYSSKLIRDIEKLKQSFQDEIVNISKHNDGLKQTLQQFKMLEKLPITISNNIGILTRNIENIKIYNNSIVTSFNTIASEIKSLKNKI